jgi:hypothetical protein
MEPVMGLEGGAAAGPLRRGEIAFSQSQERVAGLGEVSPPYCFAVRVVRGRKLTAEAVEFRSAVEGCARRELVRRA